jgi:acetylglutamate kinase
MVLGGTVNREIVELVQRGGGQAIGLTGNDGRMLLVRRREDLGRVGEVVAVDPAPIRALTEAGFIPVIAPIGVDAHGVTHNVNADEAAGAIARALRAEKLILLTDVEGVKDRSGQLIGQLSEPEVKKLVEEGTIEGGMIPKVECCLDALRGGVNRAHIVDGRILHAILLEIFTDGGVGTLLTLRQTKPRSATPRGKQAASKAR